MTNYVCKVCLFMTQGTSLKKWDDLGILDREIKPYVYLSQNHKIDFYILSYGSSDELIYETIYPIKILHVFNKKTYKSKLLNLFFGLISIVKYRFILKECNIYKSNQMNGAIVAAVCKILFNKKFILRSGYEFFSFVKLQKLNLVYKIYAYLVSLICYRWADEIVVATKNDALFVEKKFFINNTKIFIEPNWIDTDLFKPFSSTVKFNKLITISRLDNQKNLYSLIRAIKLSNSSLDIIGDGPLKQELIYFSRSIGANVNFLGNIKNSEIPALLSRYKIFILCSFYEGNPKALLEAMSCSIPIIASTVPGNKELIGQNLRGFLTNLDENSISNTIQYVFNNQTKAILNSTKARQYIIEKHSFISHVSNELIRLMN